jgi:transposase
MMLAKSMPILAVGRVVGEHDTLTWRIVTHYVNAARAQADQSGITQVGIDETASRRGQKYVSLFVDLPERKVVFVTPGKDASTVAAFAADMQVHGGDPVAVTEVSVDMSKAFAKGIAASLPNAEVTFDKFLTTGVAATVTLSPDKLGIVLRLWSSVWSITPSTKFAALSAKTIPNSPAAAMSGLRTPKTSPNASGKSSTPPTSSTPI